MRCWQLGGHAQLNLPCWGLVASLGCRLAMGLGVGSWGSGQLWGGWTVGLGFWRSSGLYLSVVWGTPGLVVCLEEEVLGPPGSKYPPWVGLVEWGSLPGSEGELTPCGSVSLTTYLHPLHFQLYSCRVFWAQVCYKEHQFYISVCCNLLGQNFNVHPKHSLIRTWGWAFLWHTRNEMVLLSPLMHVPTPNVCMKTFRVLG